MRRLQLWCRAAVCSSSCTCLKILLWRCRDGAKLPHTRAVAIAIFPHLYVGGVLHRLALFVDVRCRLDLAQGRPRMKKSSLSTYNALSASHSIRYDVAPGVLGYFASVERAVRFEEICVFTLWNPGSPSRALILATHSLPVASHWDSALSQPAQSPGADSPLQMMCLPGTQLSRSKKI